MAARAALAPTAKIDGLIEALVADTDITHLDARMGGIKSVLHGMPWLSHGEKKALLRLFLTVHDAEVWEREMEAATARGRELAERYSQEQLDLIHIYVPRPNPRSRARGSSG